MIIPKAVDCYVHLRRDSELSMVLPYTAHTCCRAIVMPPGSTPIDIPYSLNLYIAEVRKECGAFPHFQPHFACDISPMTTPEVVPEMLAAAGALHLEREANT